MVIDILKKENTLRNDASTQIETQTNNPKHTKYLKFNIIILNHLKPENTCKLLPNTNNELKLLTNKANYKNTNISEIKNEIDMKNNYF